MGFGACVLKVVRFVDESHMGFSAFTPNGVFKERESVASRIESLDGVIYRVCPLGNLRVDFLENLGQ